jgi:ribose/xylose/arabinose/galactoside ABC-type transport system permease subunit
MLGAFFGLLLLNCFNNGMTVMNVDPYWQTVASGALLLIALMLDFVSLRRQEKKLL